MAKIIQEIFVTPGLAIARLGGSSTPQCAFDWIATQAARSDGSTTIKPAWSLAVQPDGSVQPFLPDSVTFRDGDLIRPVAPFLEIWVRIGEEGSKPESWLSEPLTAAMLQEHQGAQSPDLSVLGVQVTARNLKAARRTGNQQLAFGTFPAVTLTAASTSRVPILGRSPPTAARSMIPLDRSIPLGSVQFTRSVPQPANELWSSVVNIETIRLRFTPATGEFYGPPAAAHVLRPPQGNSPIAAIHAENAFLDQDAGWFGQASRNVVEPADTYDVLDSGQTTGPSLGVVDDTCEVHFAVSLKLPDRTPLFAKAVVFVGPPDFAPDRRPFLSAADEINDREASAAARNADLSDAELDQWMADLFERVYETVSLFNLDHYRERRAAGRGQRGVLPTDKLTADDIDKGMRQHPTWAMGGRDLLRNEIFALPASTPAQPLPLSQHARMRHRAMSDLQTLIEIVSLDRERIKKIIRPPFEVESFENAERSSMRMPPFMRQSNALPLTLSYWQYELVLRWLDRTVMRMPALRPLSPTAAAVRAAASTGAAAPVATPAKGKRRQPAVEPSGTATLPAPPAAAGAAPVIAPRPLSARAEASRAAVLARIDAASGRP